MLQISAAIVILHDLKSSCDVFYLIYSQVISIAQARMEPRDKLAPISAIGVPFTCFQIVNFAYHSITVFYNISTDTF